MTRRNDPRTRGIAIWPADTADSLTLTGARRGVTNRGRGPLVVSLLPHCGPHNASEAAALPGRAGCIAAEGSSGNTPSTPGGENFAFSPPYYLFLFDS